MILMTHPPEIHTARYLPRCGRDPMPTLITDTMPAEGDRLVGDGPPARLYGTVVCIVQLRGQTERYGMVLRWAPLPTHKDDPEPRGITSPYYLALDDA